MTGRSEHYRPSDQPAQPLDHRPCHPSREPVQCNEEVNSSRKRPKEHAAVIEMVHVTAHEQDRSVVRDMFQAFYMKKSVSPQL